MTYEIDYIIRVMNAGAPQAIRDMTAAINKLGASLPVLDRLNGRIKNLNSSISSKKWRMSLDTTQVDTKLTALETRIAALRKSLTSIAATAGTAKGGTKSAGTATSSSRKAAKPSTPSGFMGSGKNRVYYGNSSPLRKFNTPGYHWVESKSLPVPKGFEKNYREALKKQGIARSVKDNGSAKTVKALNQARQQYASDNKVATRYSNLANYSGQRHNAAITQANAISQKLLAQNNETAALSQKLNGLKKLYNASGNKDQSIAKQIRSTKKLLADSRVNSAMLQNDLSQANRAAGYWGGVSTKAQSRSNVASGYASQSSAQVNRLERAQTLQKQWGMANANVADPYRHGYMQVANNPKTSSKKSGSNSNKGRGKSNGVRKAPRPNNLTYKLFGPTPLTNNGGMAVDMLKGMGIAYGIAGLGSFFGNIINDSSEYDNTMQTVENILKSHDSKGGFDDRFTQMSGTIRQVGIQTKYKVTEVADAAKFLAMAGLGVEDINAAIRPIANIALVGDTELGETADLVTNVMTAYNMQSHQMRKASDIMTNTFTMTNTTLPEIAEAYKYSASLLSAGGIDFEEATAGIGILGDAGIKGSQAGTTMRTILNNIINPRGKYRKAAWKETGIELFDKDTGQVRSLAAIFTELASKDLSVDQYYKLFDKTAAQGAVALTKHTDKWNKVIEENFMSQGMASDLADKKKNTIQGLWAQLTSSITEDGVIAFKGVENDIKNIIRDTTTWIQSDGAKESMNSLFKSLIEFSHIIMDSLSYFYRFYQTFDWAIKGMIRWQLYLWPIIKLFTTLRTAAMALIGITRVVTSIRAITLAFKGLSTVMGAKAAFGLATSNLMSYVMSGGKKPILPWTSGNVMASDGQVTNTGTAAAPVLTDRYGNPLVAMPKDKTAQSKNKSKLSRGWSKAKATGANMVSGWSAFGKGAAVTGLSLAGTTLGYAVGNAINEENGGTWGGAVGSIVGAGAGAWAMSGFSGGAALLSNPIGWGIAAAAVLAGVGIWVANTIKDINKANEATRVWKESFDNMHVSHIDLTKDNGLIISYMRIYNNSLLTEQQQLEQSIETFHRYWEAKKGPDAIKDNGPVSETQEGKELKKWLEIADWMTGKYSAMKPQFEAMGGKIASDANGHTVWSIGDEIFASTNYAALNEEEATRVALAQFGASASAPLETAENEIIKAVTSAKSAEYISDRLNSIKSTYLPETLAQYNEDLTSEDVAKWTMSEMLQSKWVQATFAPRIEQAISNWTPFISAMSHYEKSGDLLDVEDMQHSLKPILGPLFDSKQFGIIGSDQWYNKIQDIQTNYKMYGLTKEEADNYVSTTFNKLIEFYNKLDDRFKPMLAGFLDRSMWDKALAKDAGEVLMSGGFYPGKAAGMKAKDARGVEYTWQKLSSPGSVGAYGWLDKNGRQYIPDSSAGNLSLLTENGNPFQGDDAYLNDINFIPYKQYTGNEMAQVNEGFNPVKSVVNWFSNIYTGLREKLDQSGYKAPTVVQNSGAVSYGKQVLANNAVNIEHCEIHQNPDGSIDNNDAEGLITKAFNYLFA